MPNKTRRVIKKRKPKKEEPIEEHKECPICYEEMNEETIKTYTSEKNINRTIFLKFNYDTSSSIPNTIYSIYYL